MKTLDSVLDTLLECVPFVSLSLLLACPEAPLPEPPPVSAEPFVTILAPSADAVLRAPSVEVSLAVGNFVVRPASEAEAGEGYLVVVVDRGCVPSGELIPFEPEYVHLSDGALKTQIWLGVGTFHLCVQGVDGQHRALDFRAEVSFDLKE